MAFIVSTKREDQIKHKVQDIFGAFYIHRGSPQSAFEIALSLGALCIPYVWLNKNAYKEAMILSQDGFSCKYRENIWFVVYNEQTHPASIDFTILHECGHIVLGHTEESMLAEAEADCFAKYAAVQLRIAKQGAYILQYKKLLFSQL